MKVYLVLIQHWQYDDNHYIPEEGGEPLKAYATPEAAEAEAKRLNRIFMAEILGNLYEYDVNGEGLGSMFEMSDADLAELVGGFGGELNANGIFFDSGPPPELIEKLTNAWRLWDGNYTRAVSLEIDSAHAKADLITTLMNQQEDA